MTTNALGKLCSIEAETADVVGYLMIGFTGSCTNAFYLNQTCQTYPLRTDITQVVKNRYSSSGEAIAKRCCEAQIASVFGCDVYTKRCSLLSREVDLFVETFLISLDSHLIIILTLNN